MPLKVLSLFDGIGGARIALDRAGIPVEKYYSSEIDRYSRGILWYNYPDSIHLGDITRWYTWSIPFDQIDLVVAGFPCQTWSTGGSNAGLDDPKGQLLLTLMAVLEHIRQVNPNVLFLFENTGMSKHNLAIVNNIIGVEPIVINSNLLSAQNRKRLYWTNIPNVTQPEDKGLVIRDILLPDNDPRLEDTVISPEGLFFMDKPFRGKTKWEFHSNPVDGKASCLLASMSKGVPYGAVRELRRFFHPVELERLQTLPDDYTKFGWFINNHKKLVLREIFKGRRQITVGNGFTIDVIAHILRGVNDTIS